jgi:hypothetical protein
MPRHYPIPDGWQGANPSEFTRGSGFTLSRFQQNSILFVRSKRHSPQLVSGGFTPLKEFPDTRVRANLFQKHFCSLQKTHVTIGG